MPGRSRLVTVCLAVIGFAVAFGTSAGAGAQRIGPGHEHVVHGLFAPHGVGEEVGAGFVLRDISIESRQIVVTLRAEDGRDTVVTLRHPDHAPDDAPRTASFAAVEDAAPGEDAAAARAALLEALRVNDSGGFWEQAAPPTKSPRTSSSSGDGGERGEGERGERGEGDEDERAVDWSSGLPGWGPVDGILVILLVVVLALLLAVRLLVDAPRWIGPALAATVVAGALVRLALSPQVFLGSWPWSRLYVHIRAVAEGEILAAIAEQAGGAFYLTDVMMWTNLAYAVAMPLVFFSHATYLLRDARAGLFAALAVAFLPQHIRYSGCEDGFVASLVLTSLAFALIHGWLRDRSRVVRWMLLAALPVVLHPGYLLRPLNILFVGIYAAAIVGLHRDTAPPWRRWVALALVVGQGLIAFRIFTEEHAPAVQAAGNLRWLLDVPRLLFDPALLVLTDPLRTPPALILLAGVGAVLAWRAGERRLVLFLVGWLLAFVTTHAFVLQESMLPRYMLHAVVPFLLLAADGVPRLGRRWRPWLAVGVATLIASPWLHRDFVEDLDYAEIREFQFVRQAREVVPEGCTILEYVGDPDRHHPRFVRAGMMVGGQESYQQRFDVVTIREDGGPTPETPSVEEVLAEAPACLYMYEGLACSDFRGQGERYSSVCSDLREELDGEVVLVGSAPPRPYDRSAGSGKPLEVSRVPFRLVRVRGPSVVER